MTLAGNKRSEMHTSTGKCSDPCLASDVKSHNVKCENEPACQLFEKQDEGYVKVNKEKSVVTSLNAQPPTYLAKAKLPVTIQKGCDQNELMLLRKTSFSRGGW